MDVRITVKTRQQMAKIIEMIKQTTQQEEAAEYRREHGRLNYGTPATIMPADASIEAEPVYVDTRDISIDGLGLLSHRSLAPGQRVLIIIETDFGDLEVCGTVAHATSTLGGKKIGIQFDLEEDDASPVEG